MLKVLIIGAGVVGLAVAEELIRRGISVEMLERNSEVGEEASWAAAGILSPQGEAEGPGPFLDLLLAGYPMMVEAVTRLQALTQMDLRFRASGMLALAFSESDEAELDRQLHWQEKAGLTLERLRPSEVRRLEPAVDGPVRCGVFWPQTAQIDNTQLVKAYARVVEAQGGVIRTGTPVKRFLVEGDEVVGVETSQGKSKADWVVDCAGSWAGFDEALSFSIPTQPVKGQMLQFRTTTAMVHRVVKSPRAYLVQRTPERLIAGTTVERVGFDKAVTETGRRSIFEGACEMASGVRNLSLETAWAGLRPGTPDRLPILGPTPLKRLLLATGHYRNGILLAPLTGRLLGSFITTGKSPIDLSPFHVSRFGAGQLKGSDPLGSDPIRISRRVR